MESSGVPSSAIYCHCLPVPRTNLDTTWKRRVTCGTAAAAAVRQLLQSRKQTLDLGIAAMYDLEAEVRVGRVLYRHRLLAT
ncbi:hypothetical protein G6O67_006073 [Ophiocordyceps sinensis]|uniref:Uncharacterized protein n=1 Tax=Ophiocordyceps sinensis TaxID=72228 RepID=A0A8H4LYU4_9HYPO|nr:hypothetical protein G6O67_006073 [Ophiocordyceps sinensis]